MYLLIIFYTFLPFNVFSFMNNYNVATYIIQTCEHFSTFITLKVSFEIVMFCSLTSDCKISKYDQVLSSFMFPYPMVLQGLFTSEIFWYWTDFTNVLFCVFNTYLIWYWRVIFLLVIKKTFSLKTFQSI